MNPQFKVGDWIKHTYNMYVGNNNFEVKTKLLQISIAEHDVIKCTNGPEFIIARDSIELWTPQPGEWCWFWNKNKLTQELRLAQFSHKDSTFYSMHEHEFVYCEPFIGELPTFLKENYENNPQKNQREKLK